MKLYKHNAVGVVKSFCTDAKRYYSKKEDIHKTYGVAGNTFRSYTGYNIGPSIVFREWAESSGLSPRVLSRIEDIESYDDFKKLHNNMARSLNKQWIAVQRKGLTVAQLYKLVDLFVKAVSKSESLHPRVNHNLVQYGHVPLDQYSLLAVRRCFSGIVISRTPSMGDVEDFKTYEFIQGQIQELMNACRLPNLYFDYFAWNAKH